ncbi:putative hydro-lyase [Polaromonas sp. YR568]|uniref:putative hydro-lyase n=1 Tax=Polaromonas sp. YR568 TaxID=1855301 RepID=UPI00398BF30B
MTKIFDIPADLRLASRSGGFTLPTAGHAPGYIQANLMIVPQAQAFDFLLFCQRNPKPCPLVEVLEPGQWEPACAPGANLATDLPGYRVYRDGEFVEERGDISALWQKDFVPFLIGCSFSFEDAVIREGVPLRHVAQGRNVAMYRTSLACVPSGPFHGDMVVSMRPIKSRDVAKVVEVSGRFALAHGAPLHIGNPEEIGIQDLSRPDYGDAVDIMPDEVPVFWACGVTPQWIAQSSRLSLCITHAPGKMFVTDTRG